MQRLVAPSPATIKTTTAMRIKNTLGTCQGEAAVGEHEPGSINVAEDQRDEAEDQRLVLTCNEVETYCHKFNGSSYCDL
uniref:Uncharacterized protein n=1 Tax=Acrobeloides nanus TaxID=290746 RepID=A0A914CG94_9BILA